MFNFSVLDQKKTNEGVGGGGDKIDLWEKNHLNFWKSYSGLRNKKNIRQISRKDNEDDEINFFWSIWKKVNEGNEKKQAKKNIAGKCFFISWNKLCFFSKSFFYIPKLTCFINRQQFNARFLP